MGELARSGFRQHPCPQAFSGHCKRSPPARAGASLEPEVRYGGRSTVRFPDTCVRGETSRRKFIWRGSRSPGNSRLAQPIRIRQRRAARGWRPDRDLPPDGAGGYYRDSISTLLLQSALNAGAIISDCCAHAECGTSNGCMESFCDFGAGACAVAMYDGAACARSGCVDGICSGGACADLTSQGCVGDGFCTSCTYDSCTHSCDCSAIHTCYTEDYQCMDAYCDPGQGGCVTVPLNEGAACNTFGVNGLCTNGYCT